MNPDEIRKWLRPEERVIYEPVRYLESSTTKAALERLAECCEEIENLKSNLEDYKYFVKQRNERIARMKVLMEKHQYQIFYEEGAGRYCIGCGMIQGAKCKSACLWAKAIRKGE